jgi:5-methylcytosine-specific restriction enzyme subunit McrC
LTEHRTIELTEHDTRLFPREEFAADVGQLLWHHYHTQVAVEPPTFMTGDQWKLTAQGWVGFIPVTSDLGFNLLPKVPLSNLFGMLEYAYKLNSLEFPEGLYQSSSLREFYEQLAKILAQRVLDRARRGLYRAYLPEYERLPFMRGRMDLARAMRSPVSVHLPCHYEEHTADLEDNRILAWTLQRILRSGLCTERTLPTVRRARRALRGAATAVPCLPADCIKRFYHRLNEDYQPMHALCRFFLEQSGPTHTTGEKVMLPFLVNTANLYELFVAEWLKTHLGGGLVVKAQERVDLTEERGVHFQIDLVIYDETTQQAVCVLDTKYKRHPSASADDVAQVVAYAASKRCQHAVLIYPVELSQPVNMRVGDIRVRSMVFGLEGSLEEAGHRLRRGLHATMGQVEGNRT